MLIQEKNKDVLSRHPNSGVSFFHTTKDDQYVCYIAKNQSAGTIGKETRACYFIKEIIKLIPVIKLIILYK